MQKITIELTEEQQRIAQALALLEGEDFAAYANRLFVDMLSIEIERWFDGASMLPEMYKAIGEDWARMTTTAETVDICIGVTLPKNCYETIAGLVRIAGFKTLDEWASVALKQGLESIADGVVAGDMVSEKMKGRHSPEYDALANAGKKE